MNPFVDIDPPPATLQLAQLALAFVFLMSYAVTLGSFVGRRGKLRAAGIALLALVLFCSTVTPWAMGIVWAALAVGAMGGFVAITVLTSRLLGLDGQRGALALQSDAAPAPIAPRPARGPVRPAYTVPGNL